MRRISGGWLTSPQAQHVLSALEEAGHRAYAVGGCVRDALVGRPVADVDIATDARPEEVIGIAKNAGIDSVPTGIDHGTVTLVSDGHPFEVTTFRRDVETDGRRAVVDFSTELEHDAERRDFTMNALYADRHGIVVDPLGDGLADLDARRVRFIRNAVERIREDYLRILRYFRFTAWYARPGAEFDPEALDAIRSNLDGLDRLSAERITHELLRLLLAPDPVPSLLAMEKTGTLQAILPGADVTGLTGLLAAETEAGADPAAIRRLAALGEAGLAHLRLSKKDQRTLRTLSDEVKTDTNTGEIAYRHGEDIARDVAVLRKIRRGISIAGDLSQQIETGASARFPVRAADLMPGYQGAVLGEKLAELEDAWIASGFTLSRDNLLGGS